MPAAAAAVIVGLGDAATAPFASAPSGPISSQAMVVPGGMPAGRERLEGSEAMASSDTVVDAFLSMCETDYRGALRSLVTAGNPQMNEEEIRERVRLQAEYLPQETRWPDCASGWTTIRCKPARSCGERLWLLCAENTGGGWFPSGREAAKLSRQLFPDAHVEEIEDGILSRPDLTAAVVRRVTAQLRAARA